MTRTIEFFFPLILLLHILHLKHFLRNTSFHPFSFQNMNKKSIFFFIFQALMNAAQRRNKCPPASTAIAVTLQPLLHLQPRAVPVKPGSSFLSLSTRPKAQVRVETVPPVTIVETIIVAILHIRQTDLLEENTSAKCVLKQER